MAQAVGISCKRSPSPRSGRKMPTRSGDFSVVERARFAAEHNRCCAFALPTDSERREPHSFARFAGSWGARSHTHGLRHGLYSFARFAGSRPHLSASSATHQLGFCAPLPKHADPGSNALVAFLGEGPNSLKETHF